MQSLNELEEWVPDWFENPASEEDPPSLVDAATITTMIQRLREEKEEK